MKPSDYIQKGWCQGEYAVDSEGFKTAATGAHAVKWCALGAIRAAYGKNWDGSSPASVALAKKVGDTVEWNDHPSRTQQEVVSMLQSINE